MPLAPGQVIKSCYCIVKLLGQGGFGAIYRAWDMNLAKPCALKENLETSPEAQHQFRMRVSGNWTYWYPAGTFSTCMGIK